MLQARQQSSSRNLPVENRLSKILQRCRAICLSQKGSRRTAKIHRARLDAAGCLVYFSTVNKRNVEVCKEEGVWSVRSPSTPGVYGLGDTKRAALADYHSALRDDSACQKRMSGKTEFASAKLARPFAIWLKQLAARRGLPMYELLEELVANGKPRPWRVSAPKSEKNA